MTRQHIPAANNNARNGLRKPDCHTQHIVYVSPVALPSGSFGETVTMKSSPAGASTASSCGTRRGAPKRVGLHRETQIRRVRWKPSTEAWLFLRDDVSLLGICKLRRCLARRRQRGGLRPPPHLRQQSVDDAPASLAACPCPSDAVPLHLFVRRRHVRRVEDLGQRTRKR